MSLPFSVSMCVYGKDNPEHFKIAVESIINQTVKPNEVVLVVDGLVPDNLNCIIKGFEKSPIFKVLRLKENKGHGVARRIGLKKCTHELVALMDADDISVSNRFELQLKQFEKDSNVSIVGGNICEFIDDINNVVGKRIVPQNDKDIKNYMKKRCPMNQMTVMFKKSDVNAAGGYLDWYCDEDYYLWLRMCLKGFSFYNIQKCLVNVRVGKEMYQRRGGYSYFASEAKLQKFMLDKGIIPTYTYLYNVLIRFCVQVLMPNKVRGWVFQRFARSN